jgi:hypothetical protein
MGTYATQLDCESDTANINTPCFVITSINEIESSNKINKIYDVLGREYRSKVGNLENGLYIIDNVKVIINK